MGKNLTYEFDNKTKKLERYEWDNLWWSTANDEENKPRILVIGDSISCGYRHILNDMYEGEAYIDGIGTSKAIDNKSLHSLTAYFKEQFPGYKIIQINNGLHGWHVSVEDYEKCYIEYVECVKGLFPEAKLVIALSSYLSPDKEDGAEKNARITKLNEAALRVAEKFGTEINRIDKIVENSPELFSADKVHLVEEGYKLIAQQTKDIFDKLM